MVIAKQIFSGLPTDQWLVPSPVGSPTDDCPLTPSSEEITVLRFICLQTFSMLISKSLGLFTGNTTWYGFVLYIIKGGSSLKLDF